MTATISSARTAQVYVRKQSAVDVPGTMAESDALSNVVSCEFTPVGVGAISRPNLNALGGEAASAQGPREWEIKLVVEFTTPTTTGDTTTWQHEALWQSCFDITDNGSTLTLEPLLSNDVGGFSLLNIELQTLDGLTHRATNARVVPTAVNMQGGQILTVEFTGRGKWEAPEAAALAVAPVPANGGSRTVVRDMTYSDGVNTSDVFGLTLTTGLSLSQRIDQTTDGYAVPVLHHDGVEEVSATVLSDVDYFTAMTGETDLTAQFVFGTGAAAIQIDLSSYRVVDVVSTEVEMIKALDVTMRGVTGTSLPLSFTLGT